MADPNEPTGSDLQEIARPEIKHRMSQFEGKRHRETIANVPPSRSRAATTTEAPSVPHTEDVAGNEQDMTPQNEPEAQNADQQPPLQSIAEGEGLRQEESTSAQQGGKTDDEQSSVARTSSRKGDSPKSSRSPNRSKQVSVKDEVSNAERHRAEGEAEITDEDENDESYDDEDDDEDNAMTGPALHKKGEHTIVKVPDTFQPPRERKRTKFAKAMLLKPQHEVRHSIKADSDAWGDGDVAQPLAADTTIDIGTEGLSDGSRTNRRKPRNCFQNMLKPFHNFFMLLPVQSLMFLLLLVDLAFLFYEFIIDKDTEWGTSVTMATSSTFLFELLCHIGYLGTDFFFFDKKWQVAEVGIVTISFIIELTVFLLPDSNDIANWIRYLRIVRAFRILILWKTRFRHFRTSLRQLVSADRRRYQKNGFDLDLTYVETNIIAMSWPSESMESIYRNHIDNVSRFMDVIHPEKYWIYNLCSERQYDETKFHNRVTRYRLDDHNPAELWSMFSCAQDVTLFLGKDPANIVAIHCKGGKGRTGTMTCAYLLYSRRQPDADSAMTHFGRMRTSDSAKSFQGVESPSQGRYLKYFDRLLKTIDERTIMQKGIPTRRVRITKLVLRYVPAMFVTKGLDRLWFTVITAPSSDRSVIYISNPTVTFSADVPLKGGHKGSTGPSAYEPPTPSGSIVGDGGNKNGPRAQTLARARSASAAAEEGCKPFGGNMVAYLNGDESQPVDCESATKYFKTFVGSKGTTSSSSNVNGVSSTFTPSNSSPTQEPPSPINTRMPRVDVAFSTSAIPPVSADTIIKFFYNVDAPNPLHPPLQFWFHPYFEETSLVMNKIELDGPHKEGFAKQKKWSNGVSVEMEIEDV